MPVPATRVSVEEEFRRRFGREPEVVVRAPGRVNLIGEHTDYNDGFVMPMAIDRWVTIAARPRTDGRVTLHSIDLNDEGSFTLGGQGEPSREWIDYVRGVAWALSDGGKALTGFDGVVSGNVPVGAGLSSSAAFEMAATRVFAAVSGFEWEAVDMARAGQRAENLWMGVNCGIMDQLISAGGQAGHAILIDCRSLDMRPVPLSRDVAVVVLDTTTRRQLVGSEYNDRRDQCAAAAAACGASSLRDVSQSQLDAGREAMGEVAFRRARHVLSENDRTLRAAEAMRAGDARLLGQMMNESHQSLRDDYEVSTRALDAMAESARSAPGCHGARLTGAGFGGCVVALVDRHRLHGFAPQAVATFTATMHLVPAVYPCEAVGGAEVVGPV
ncbi:MAG TPA: galactokinase [Vicinamibacteria bacterium]|nr:galactokinase [Vicinamibacteria bacterium]